jgi:hypothetical protein
MKYGLAQIDAESVQVHEKPPCSSLYPTLGSKVADHPISFDLNWRLQPNALIRSGLGPQIRSHVD